VNPDNLEPALDRIREYFAAFQRGDSDAYAQQWVYPACFLVGGRWSTLPTPEACRESNEHYHREAREQGMLGGRILELTARAEGPDAAWVEGRFSREGAAGRVIAETRAAYLVVRTDEGWRVAVCVLKD
jgi:ketosteroid isomerase-like protein